MMRAVLIGILSVAALAEVIPVSIEARDDGFALLRGGKVYSIKGAGGDRLEALAAAGGNSTRTWDDRNLGPLLDRAHALGLSVTVGFWLGHERHGFDYTNEQALHEQRARCLETVRRYRNHPAVLLWAIGNEMEGDGGNAAIWRAIEAIASEIKAQDPHHPTMTVLAEIGGNKIAQTRKYCPSIDILGVNSYAGVGNLGRRLRAAGWERPFVVTEFGPRGHWESQTTAWGAKLEGTSTAKGKLYARHYQALADDADCLGSYAFLFGHKQEATATWYGMVLPDGTRLEAVDSMREAWGATAPENRCPQISAISADRVSKLVPGDEVTLRLEANDPEGDAFSVEWRLVPESGQYSVGGDAEVAMPAVPDAVLEGSVSGARLRVPESGGPYRVYVYLRDGKGGGATANLPIHVEAPKGPIALPQASLPFAIGSSGPYFASGYMGNQGAVKVREDDGVMTVDFVLAQQWAGLVWQSPANDWGNKPGGLNLNGASFLRFRARGSTGGERVTFGFGILGEDKKFADSAHHELKDTLLGTDWQDFEIPLAGKDLHQIKTPFYWVTARQDKPLGFSLSEIRYE